MEKKMISFIKSRTNFDFVGSFKFFAVFSTLATIIALVLTLTKMNYGVDFRGGAEIQAKFNQTVPMDQIRTVIDGAGFKGTSVQSIGEDSDNEVLIKVQGDESTLNILSQKMQDTLNASFKEQGVELRKVDIVGPKAGAHLRSSAFQAMLWAILAIMVYIGIRFDFRFAPGAMISLFHDVALICGFMAITGMEFTLQIVAAILALVGYSINDTVIVFDRIREHEEKTAGLDLGTHINNAVNETLSRTIMTSGFTLIVCVSMVIFGGMVIRDFFIVMSLGILVGTYSSVFVASASTLYFDRLRAKYAKTLPPM